MEARLLTPIFPSLVWRKYRQAEIIVGICRQIGCQIAVALPWPAKPDLFGYAPGVSLEADQKRVRTGKLSAKDRPQKVTVADGVGFIGSIGFHRPALENCPGRFHLRPHHFASLRAAS